MNNTQLQVWLSNTAHQREVADLQAAGLNPILSANGAGAAVPNVMGGSGISAKSAKGGSGGKSIVDILDQSLKNSNSALRIANNAIRVSGNSRSHYANVKEDLVPLSSIVSPIIGTSNSAHYNGPALNQEWKNLWNYIENFSLDDINLRSISEGARLLREAVGKPNGHHLSEADAKRFEELKKAHKKAWNKALLNELENQANTARSLLGR